MADNLKKYTTQEVLNKVYTDSSGDTIGLQAQTSKETLNAVLNTSTNSLNVSLSGSNTISGDVTITGDLTVQGSGTNAYDEIVQGQLVVQTGSSGATADTNADELVVESNGNAGISILTPNASIGQLAFGSDGDAYGAFVSWQGSTNQMTIATANADDSIVLQTANKVTALTIDSNQNVGIGGTPSNQLTVVGDSAIKNINIYTNSDAAVTSDTGARIFTTGDGGSGIYGENGHLVIQGRPAGRDIIFLSGSSATERMRIDSSGNVGIGIDPTSTLDINISTDARGSFTSSIGEVGSGVFALQVTNAAGSALKPMGIRAEDIRLVTGSVSALTLGSSGVATFGGDILPATDDAQDLGSSSKRFDDVFASGGVTTTSDQRLKDNIADSSLGLDFVNALRPVEYKFKDYTYDVEKDEAVEAIEAKEAVMGTRQKTVSKEVEKTRTEIVEEDGKYVQKEISYTETVEEPQYEEVNLYDEDGEVIGLHKIPITEEYEVEPATEAIEAKDAVMETKEKTFARTHFGLIAQEVEQVLKDSSLTNNDFAGLIYDEDADRYGIRYHELISPLIKAVQELSKKVTDLENK